MAVELLGKYSKLEGRNLPLDKVYVYADVGALEHGTVVSKMDYVSLDDLLVYINDSQSRKVRDLRDFRAELAKGNVYFKRFTSADIDPTRRVPNTVELYAKDLDLPNTYLSNSINTDTETVEHGLMRELEVKSQDDFNGPYVYVGLIDNPNMQFVKKEDIGYYEAGRFISIDGKRIEDFKDKDLYTRHGNVFVTKMFTDATCSFEIIKQRESYDLDKMKRTTLVESRDGTIVPVEEDIDPYYSEQIMRPDGDDVMLEVMNYAINPTADGEFVLLRYAGENVDTLVPIDSLYYSRAGSIGDKIEDFKSNRNSLIGQSVYVKLADGSTYMTEPVTYEQVHKTYSKHETMQITEDESAILADGTYLKLQDGRYVKENETVRPICYEFVSGDDFDAYVVKLDTPTADGQTSVIVDKSTFARNSTVVLGGLTLELKNAFKIKETNKAMKDCDVIQTSSNHNDIEQCVLLSEPSYNMAGALETTPFSDADKEAAINKAKSQFESSYKQGNYDLERVVDDHGDLVELDKQKHRYQLSNVTQMKDYGNENYAYLRSGKVKYDANKKQLVGGPKFDTKKYIKSGYKMLGARTVDAFSMMFSSWGLLVVLVMPQILIAAAAAITATAVLNPVIYGIIGAIINRKQNFKLNTDKHRKKLKAEIIDDLKDVIEDTKHTEKAKLNENRLLDRFETIDNKIISLCATKRISSFRMVNGVGAVNRTNAGLYSEFRRDMTEREEELKQLKKAVKKDPSLQATLDAKQSQYDQKIRYYISQGVIEPKDRQMREMMERSSRTKGFLLAKHFGLGSFTDEEKEIIESADYKVDKNEFVFSSRKDKRKMKGKVKDINKSMADIIKKDEFKALSSKKYDYSTCIVSSVNITDFSAAPPVSADASAEHSADAEHTYEAGAEHTADPSGPAPDLSGPPPADASGSPDRKKKGKSSTRTAVDIPRVNSKQFDQELHTLMLNIDELYKLTNKYGNPDEDYLSVDEERRIEQLKREVDSKIILLEKASKSKRYKTVDRQTNIEDSYAKLAQIRINIGKNVKHTINSL